MKRFIKWALAALLLMTPMAAAAEDAAMPPVPETPPIVAQEEAAPYVLDKQLEVAAFFGPGNYGGFNSSLIGGAGPGSIPGLVIHITPESMSNDGTNVTAWDNLAGTFDFSQSTSSKRFRYAATANPNSGPAAQGNATNNSSMYLDASGLGILNGATGCTTFAVWKTTGTQAQSVFYADTGTGSSTNRFTHHHQQDSNGNGSITFRTPGNASDSYGFENTFGSNSGVYTDNTWGVETVRHDVPANHATISYNGRVVGDTSVWYFAAGSGYTAADSTRIAIGAGGDAGQWDIMRNDGYIAELLVYNRPLTYAQEKIVWDYIHAEYPSIAKAYGSETHIVLYRGDSIQQSLTKVKDSIPLLATYGLSSPELVYWRNDGRSGWTIQQVDSDITGAKGILNGTYPSHLSLADAIDDLSVGTNNVASGSESAATAFGRLTTQYATLTTNNVAVNSSGVGRGRIICKQLPRTNNATTTNVFALNTEMTNRYNELANVGVEGIVDPTSLAAFDGSPDGLTDVSDTTYYNGDKIHPNATGDALIAPLHTAQIEQIRKRRQIETLYGQYIKAWYAAGEEIMLNSGNVSSWGDRNGSTTNYDMVQATAAKRPLFSTNYRLGFPGVDFDGAANPNNDFLAVGSSGLNMLRNNNNVLMMGVIAPDSATPAANEYVFLSAITGSNSTARCAITHTTANKISLAARNQDGGSADSTTSTATIGTSPSVIAVYADMANTDSYIWLNGTLDTTDLTFDNGVSPKKLADTDAGWVGIGSHGGNGNIFNGKISEFIIMADFPDKATEDAARDLIEEYLGKKFTITVSALDSELLDNVVPFHRPWHEVARAA